MRSVPIMNAFPGPKKLGWDHHCTYDCDECDQDLYMEWLIQENDRVQKLSPLAHRWYTLRLTWKSTLYQRCVYMPMNVLRLVWMTGCWKTALKHKWLHKSWYTTRKES